MFHDYRQSSRTVHIPITIATLSLKFRSESHLMSNPSPIEQPFRFRLFFAKFTLFIDTRPLDWHPLTVAHSARVPLAFIGMFVLFRLFALPPVSATHSRQRSHRSAAGDNKSKVTTARGLQEYTTLIGFWRANPPSHLSRNIKPPFTRLHRRGVELFSEMEWCVIEQCRHKKKPLNVSVCTRWGDVHIIIDYALKTNVLSCVCSSGCKDDYNGPLCPCSTRFFSSFLLTNANECLHKQAEAANFHNSFPIPESAHKKSWSIQNLKLFQPVWPQAASANDAPVTVRSQSRWN